MRLVLAVEVLGTSSLRSSVVDAAYPWHSVGTVLHVTMIVAYDAVGSLL